MLLPLPAPVHSDDDEVVVDCRAGRMAGMAFRDELAVGCDSWVDTNVGARRDPLDALEELAAVLDASRLDKASRN